MDALLGVAFVAQLPSMQPEVVCLHCAQEFEPVSPRTSRSSSLTGGLPKPGELPMDALGMPMASSVEDLREKLRECFGVPAKIFAKLLLPDEEISNQPLFLEIDAGQRETLHRHNELSHLLFVSFPCMTSEVSSLDNPSVSSAEGADPLAKVQCFNLVYVLDSRRVSRVGKQASILLEISKRVSMSLLAEEEQTAYVSKEIRRLASVQILCDSDSETLPAGLDTLVAELYAGARHRSLRSFNVNGNHLCHACFLLKEEDVPAADQTLAFSCDREALLAELAKHSAAVPCFAEVSSLVAAAALTTSFRELVDLLNLPICTIQKAAQHLVQWKKARVVDVFTEETRVALIPDVDTSAHSLRSQRFQALAQRVAPAMDDSSELTFEEVAATFSGGQQLCEIKDYFLSSSAFEHILEWLLAEDLLVQLATYYHFLPSSAKQPAANQNVSANISSEIREHFIPKLLSEAELLLLASRSSNAEQLLFLCRFVAGFARAHQRTDSNSFARLASQFKWDNANESDKLQAANALITSNDDIFVPYVCRR
eukprot:TRINITY_DN91488_c0_g1_i1.p1 TRINITY_DN91488_c0_g1~~TRINITY_DN91488_c0_g1_i1.p1  ORF type:complete len:540 (-),score=98.13 TRINITY_DN91488_c0_g1_i1:58-1677(-)